MTSEEFKKLGDKVWEVLKPLLQFLFVVIVLMSIALIPMSFVWGFNLNDIAFQILVIADISVLSIFVLGFVFVGIRFLFTGISRKEEIFCEFCDEIITEETNICPNCGRKIVTKSKEN